jgi:hypothetical protein
MSNAQTMPGSLLDQVAAAHVLALGNHRTLAAWRLRRQGPPYIRCGKAIRYSVDDLRAWIDGNRVTHSA